MEQTELNTLIITSRNHGKKSSRGGLQPGTMSVTSRGPRSTGGPRGFPPNSASQDHVDAMLIEHYITNVRTGMKTAKHFRDGAIFAYFPEKKE